MSDSHDEQASSRADTAQTRIFEATCGDLEWLEVARIQHDIAHGRCPVLPSTAERWDAVQALEEIASNLEQTYTVR